MVRFAVAFLFLSLALISSPAPAGQMTLALPAKADPAPRPFMGWSSWSSMRGNISESAIKAQARVMAAKLKPFGYIYVNIDANWSLGFDKYGRPKPNLRRFPDGIVGMASWLHARGLKLGIYLVPGLSRAVYQANDRIRGTRYTVRQIADPLRNGNTLGSAFCHINYNRPGARAYIQSWANLLARWGVDYIKLDFVGPGGGYRGFRRTDNRADVAQWAAALKRTGRPVWLELSNSLAMQDAGYWKRYANGWRIDGDIEAYHTAFLTSWNRVRTRFSAVPLWDRFAGPGGWNDLDSLEIGNGNRDGLTLDERKSVMTFWCISGSPLCLGANLTNLKPEDINIITNRSLIAIDQSGRVAVPLSQSSLQQVWLIRNAGSYIVAVFNLGHSPTKINLTWISFGFSGRADVTDIWTHRPLGRFSHGFTFNLRPHASRLLRVTPSR